MTQERHRQRAEKTLEDINAALPGNDPDVQRAIDAVRESTPGHVITALEEEGLFDEMLERMKTRFGGRPLHDIETAELVRSARDSADAVRGIKPLSRPAPEFPQPRVTSTASEDAASLAMGHLTETVAAWEAGDTTAAEAVHAAKEVLQDKDGLTP